MNLLHSKAVQNEMEIGIVVVLVIQWLIELTNVRDATSELKQAYRNSITTMGVVGIN